MAPVDLADGNAVSIGNNLNLYLIGVRAGNVSRHLSLVARSPLGVDASIDGLDLNDIVDGELAVPMKLLGIVLRPERGSSQYKPQGNKQQEPDILGRHNPNSSFQFQPLYLDARPRCW